MVQIQSKPASRIRVRSKALGLKSGVTSGSGVWAATVKKVLDAAMTTAASEHNKRILIYRRRRTYQRRFLCETTTQSAGGAVGKATDQSIRQCDDPNAGRHEPSGFGKSGDRENKLDSKRKPYGESGAVARYGARQRSP